MNAKDFAISFLNRYDNGFKRMHRYNTECLTKLQLCLSNELYDRYRQVLKVKPKTIEYFPLSLKDHLANWDLKLDSAIREFAELNKEHFNKAGFTNDILEKIVCLMMKNYEKTGRYYKRFEESGWSAHDCHYVDDFLHKKYKKREKEHK